MDRGLRSVGLRSVSTRRTEGRPRSSGLWVECPLCKKKEGYSVSDLAGAPLPREELVVLAALMDGSSRLYAIKPDATSSIGRCEFCQFRPIRVEVIP